MQKVIMLTFLMGPMISFSWTVAASNLENIRQDIQQGTRYTQTTKEKRCPKIIILKDSEYQADGSKTNDKTILLESIENSGDFTAENSTMHIRPGLALGEMHNISRKLDFPLGIAYASTNQYENKDQLASYHSALVASAYLTDHVSSSIIYNSAKGTITYKIKASGINDINCTFEK